ncbi:unnamed protein product [Lepeophtheirus salmonis]|uniref:(salmon louse) hypothetical protein n=1 Tax=Lepeophtheirus salmonis TaxID=72036 RepID=A0A7R8CJS5_LEPSM|nr:unnamed protein product [Lepeophtheirus salmonis]CAF2844451.1 unnamed protein product [Lepeophtheirus salmonis]
MEKRRSRFFSPTSLDMEETSLSLENPREYFELFFDQNLRYLIILESNRYASQHNTTLDLTEDELFVFIGVFFLSCTSSSPHKKRYWSNSEAFPHVLGNNIGRDRFLNILKYIHFVHNTKIEKSDTRAKLRPFFKVLQASFLEFGATHEYSAIDESMAQYYGRHHAKQFIRGKPIRFGYKIWSHCSRGV